MRSLPLLVALCATASAALAQANCTAGAGPAATLATRTPFSGNSLYGHPNYPNAPGPSYTGFSFLFDITLTAPIDLSQIDIDLYDDGGLVNTGTGTVTSPNQVGATANVELWIYPNGSWVGQETNPAVWGLLGAGNLTVNRRHTHSPGVFTSPISLPAGTWGLAFKVDMTTTGPNPGPLHPMLDPNNMGMGPPPTPTTFNDSIVTITNLQFQRESWTATLAPANHWQNIEWHYTPTSGYANWTSFGTGCVAPNEPTLSLTSRPVIGSTVTFQTSNIQTGTSLNFWLFGFAANPAGSGLGAFGLPGCNLYLQLGTPITTNITGVNNGVSTVPLAIPMDPSYVGVVLYGQAAPMTPGFNAGGFFASNAICAAIGLF